MSAPQIRAHVGHAMCAAAEYDTDVVRYQRTPYVVRRARERTGGLVKSSWVACRVPGLPVSRGRAGAGRSVTCTHARCDDARRARHRTLTCARNRIAISYHQSAIT